MCGVFGYAGKEKRGLGNYLVEGLEKLQYRGYDSSGIAVFKNGKVKIVKETGELRNLKKRLKGRNLSGNLGIGHTRWATHGGVSKKNAHPHTDCSGKIVVVHNGIMENYEEIKARLVKKGHKFRSDTDTEIFPHLVEEKVSRNKDLSFAEAVRAAFKEIKGLNAVCACYADGEIVAFRKGSPLIAGIGGSGNYVSSDIPGLSSITRKIIILEEDEGASVTKDRVLKINSKTGKTAPAESVSVNMEEIKADKGGFPHFLLKEIFEEPEVVARVAASDKKEINEAVGMIKKSWGTYFTACGTAAHSGLAATYLFSEIAKRHVNFAFGSEFPYFNDFLVGKSLLIAASQSGETMDTLEAVRSAKKKGAKVLSLVNVPGSTLTRLSDKTILLGAGPERAVLATKSYIAKLSFFLLFSYAIAGKLNQGIKILKETSKQMSGMFKGGLERQVKKLSKKLYQKEHVYLIGRGVNYATALEGALKIKEASYIHAEGFPAGELKHGVIALIEKGTPTICVVANDRAKESVLSNAMELKTRGASIIGISPKNESVFDFWIKVPDAGTASPIVSIVPIQLLAYHLTVLRGYNPDMPRNLAKSVTVK